METKLKKYGLSFLVMNILSYLFFQPTLLLAAVNMKNASYIEEWIDLKINSSGFELKRIYDSKSSRKGWFGMGWCSNLENKMHLQRQDRLLVHICGQEAPLQFFRESSTRFRRNSKSSDSIRFENGLFIYTQAYGLRQIFNSNGDLIEYTDLAGRIFKLTYTESRLPQNLVLNSKLILSFQVDERTGQLTKVQHANLITEYKYDDNANLLTVKNSNNELLTYSYDDLHNLIEINYPNKKFKTLLYDQTTDQLHQLIDVDQCKEAYSFSAKDGRSYLQATLNKNCEGRMPLKIEYEFWFSKESESSLLRFRTVDLAGSQETFFDPINGYALKTIKYGNSIDFTYDLLGRVKSKKSNRYLYKYEYSGEYLTQAMQFDLRDKNQSPAFFYFQYNDKTQLSSAKSSLGQVAHFDYNSLGQIQSIHGIDGQGLSFIYTSDNENSASTRTLQNSSTDSPVSRTLDYLLSPLAEDTTHSI